MDCLLDGPGTAAHQQTYALQRRLTDRHRFRQRTCRYHSNAVRQQKDLIEILRNDHHGSTGCGEGNDRLMNGKCRPGVDAPCRLADDEHCGIEQHFAADQKFL